MNDNLLTLDEIREKNEDLLLTDIIKDSKVETARDESINTVMTWVYGDFEYPIPESSITPTLKKCFKLVAASSLIKDNYSDNEQALSVANAYYKEAQDDVKAIKSSRQFNKQPEVAIFNKPVTHKSGSDNRADDYISKLNEKYR